MKKIRFPLLFKYKDPIEGVILEDKLSSSAEVLCKERKVLSIKDCAVSLFLLLGA